MLKHPGTGDRANRPEHPVHQVHGRKRTMKKAMVAGIVLMLTVVMALPAVQAQDVTNQQANQQEGGWYCPRMGRGCIMGAGRGQGPAGQGCLRRAVAAGPLSKEQARQLLEGYVKTSGIPGLKLGGFEERGEVYEGAVVTDLGAPVGKIQVDKNTGFIRNAS